MPYQEFSRDHNYTRVHFHPGTGAVLLTANTTWAKVVGSLDRPSSVRKKKPQGWLNPTGYSFSMEKRPAAFGEFTRRISSSEYARYSGELSGPSGNFTTINHLSTGDVKSRAEMEALLALKQQRVNLGVAFGECQKTADFVGNVAYTFVDAIRKAKKGRFRDALKALGNKERLPETLLGVQYGLRPLMNDVKGAYDALRQQPQTAFVVTTKGTASISEDHDYVQLLGNANCRVVGKRSVGAYVRLDYVPSNTFLSTLASVGMTNPFEVMYELVPWSFVADWFLPVGDYLSTLDATLGFEFKSGSCSIFKQNRHEITSGGANGNYIGGVFSRIHRAVQLDRTVYASTPHPLPRLKNPLSLEHMANGLALLRATTR